jgi:hypothetical protein
MLPSDTYIFQATVDKHMQTSDDNTLLQNWLNLNSPAIQWSIKRQKAQEIAALLAAPLKSVSRKLTPHYEKKKKHRKTERRKNEKWPRKTTEKPENNPTKIQKHQKSTENTQKYGAKLELTSRIRPPGTRVDRPLGGAAAFNK